MPQAELDFAAEELNAYAMGAPLGWRLHWGTLKALEPPGYKHLAPLGRSDKTTVALRN